MLCEVAELIRYQSRTMLKRNEKMKKNVWLSLCFLVMISFAEVSITGAEYGLGRTAPFVPLEWMKTKNHSTGTWVNYSNPYDYYQPADYGARLQMLENADRLFRQAYGLEKLILKEIGSDQSAESRQSRREVQEIRESAYTLREHIRFGSHWGELSMDLLRLEKAIESQWWRNTQIQAVIRNRLEMERLAGRIRIAGGTRPEIVGDAILGNKSVQKRASSGSKPTKRIGLSASIL